MKKVRGEMSVVLGILFFMGVLICVWFQIRVREYQLISAYVEDGIVMSNLASAVMDVELYGRTHQIRIEEEKAFDRFEDALKRNLMLSENLFYEGNLPIVGEIEIATYQIYQVLERNVECVVFDGEGRIINRLFGELGQVYAPDGVLVESTTVYSKVNFRVKGWGNKSIWGTKEKSIDIVGTAE